MFTFLTIIYVLVCLFLIFVVLLQPGRGGLGGAFGGGAGQQVFGGAGATLILRRMTAISASIFILLSITLAYLSSTDSQAFDAAYRSTQREQREREQRSRTSMRGASMQPASTTPSVMAAPAASPASTSSEMD